MVFNATFNNISVIPGYSITKRIATTLQSIPNQPKNLDLLNNLQRHNDSLNSVGQEFYQTSNHLSPPMIEHNKNTLYDVCIVRFEIRLDIYIHWYIECSVVGILIRRQKHIFICLFPNEIRFIEIELSAIYRI